MNAPVAAAAKKKSQRSESRNLPECRIAFPFLHEKRTKNAAGLPLKNGPRHDCTILLPKLSADPATCPNYKILADMCMEAASKMWPGVGWPQGGNWPIKDGDIPYVSKPKPGVVPKTAEQIAASNAWRVGHWVIEATNNLEPGPRIAVMSNGVMNDIPAKAANGVQYYKSGDYGIPHISAFAYENDTFGASYSVDGVLFTRPGEPIGSSGPKSTSAMFGNVAHAAPATGGAPMPPGGYAQPAPSAPLPPAAAPVATYAPPAAPLPPAASPPLAPPAPTLGVPMPPVGLPAFPRPA